MCNRVAFESPQARQQAEPASESRTSLCGVRDSLSIMDFQSLSETLAVGKG